MKKAIRFLFTLCAFLFLFLTPAKAAETYVVDEAELLTYAQLSGLEKNASEISQKYQVDVVVRVKTGVISNDIDAYAQQLFDAEGIGYGSDRDTIMFLIDWDHGTFTFFSHGAKANAAFTDYAKTQLEDAVLPLLNEGNFNDAFLKFMTESSSILNSYELGNPVDINGGTETTKSKSGVWGAILGLPPVAALLTLLGMKSKNKTKFVRSSASNYVSTGGVQLYHAEDRFLERTVTRREIPKNQPSKQPQGGTTVNSHGSSTHSGSFKK